MNKIYGLKCNGICNPKGITDENPVLSWKLSADHASKKQLAYRILVIDENDTEVWNSGKRKSQTVCDSVYEGRSLTSHTLYRWSVISYSDTGEELKSKEAFFSIGMLTNEWKAKWIEADQKRKSGEECTEMRRIFTGEIKSSEHPEDFLNPPVYLRKTFDTRGKVKKALIYATARGIYQLRVNGNVVSELFAPGYTSYPNYLEVQQYDVTEYLNDTYQTLGIILADGWFTGKIGLVGIGNQYGENNGFYMQAEIFYEDGSHEMIISDGSFKWSIGNYRYADLFIGEYYCQNQIENAWEEYSYNDENWKMVVEKEYSTENFKGRKAEPVRELRRKKAAEIFISPKGEMVIDAGENIVGYLAVTMCGKAGQKVRFIHSETLDRDGNFLMNIIGQNKNQTDVFEFDAKGIVEYQPQFTFHGFQFVKVEGLCREDLLQVEICIVGTDLEPTGLFECSDEKLNKLQDNIFRSQQGNMVSIPTDCPQRERAGWTGDMQIFMPTACFNMDMLSFINKWLENMRYEQMSDGQIPNIVPLMDSDKYVTNTESEHICSAAWGDACIILPYTLYWCYGDKRVLEDNYKMIEKWMEYVEKQASTSFLKPIEEYTKEELENQKYLWNTEFHFGDWLFPSGGAPFETAHKTKEYVSAAMYAYTTGLMAELCEVLNKEKEHLYYQELQKKIKEAFANVYIDKDGKMPVSYQGIYVLALYMGLYPQDKKELGIRQLVKLIEENDFCLDTGFASIGFLLDTLYECGEKEVAYKLLFQEKCPSWLYEVAWGATTIWERWNAILPDGTRTNASYNHFSFGCVGDFIYRRIGGLYAEEPGYKRIRIEPDITCGLEWARTSYESKYGTIEVEWKKANGEVLLTAVIPPQTTGFVKLGDIEKEVTEGSITIRI